MLLLQEIQIGNWMPGVAILGKFDSMEEANEKLESVFWNDIYEIACAGYHEPECLNNKGEHHINNELYSELVGYSHLESGYAYLSLKDGFKFRHYAVLDTDVDGDYVDFDR